MYLRTVQIISLFASLYPPLVPVSLPQSRPHIPCHSFNTGNQWPVQHIHDVVWSSYEQLINGSFCTSSCVLYWGHKSLLLLSELIEDSSWNVNFFSILNSRNICSILECPRGRPQPFSYNKSGWWKGTRSFWKSPKMTFQFQVEVSLILRDRSLWNSQESKTEIVPRQSHFPRRSPKAQGWKMPLGERRSRNGQRRVVFWDTR